MMTDCFSVLLGIVGAAFGGLLGAKLGAIVGALVAVRRGSTAPAVPESSPKRAPIDQDAEDHS